VANAWGAQDERGAANLIDPAATLRGIAAVRTGQVLSLALPIVSGDRGAAVDMRAPPQHFMTRHGGDYAAGLREGGGYGYSDDVLMIPTHGATHIDALSHVWREGIMYNGFKADCVTSRGASRCGIDKLGPLVTRGIFLDLVEQVAPDRAVELVDLQREFDRIEVTPEPGDALLVRTGWLRAWRAGAAGKDASAGLHHECGPWLADRGIALIGADNIAVEVMPSRDPNCAMPLHIALTRDRGVFLAELFDLEELSRAARATFMLVIAPLAIRGGVGSPITPVAVL
jgi:kynurenine formamidase